MNTIVISLKRSVDRTLSSSRWLTVIAILLIALAALGGALLINAQPQALSYQRRYIVPNPAVLCPGDAFEFPIIISIETSDAVARVTEGWCIPDGICPDKWQAPEKKYNFVDPYALSDVVTRTVPADISPGVWQLRHCNETRYTQGVDVTCYQVQLTVKDCQAEP